MHYETSRTVPAAIENAWRVLTDTERWPALISTYESVRRTEPGPLAVGSGAEIKQKGFRAATWRVTELTDGRSFTWENSQAGVRTVGSHTVTAEPDGRVRITLALDQNGWLAGAVNLTMGGKVRSYVDTEADALAAAAVGAGASGAADAESPVVGP
jgi:hypothetical protein